MYKSRLAPPSTSFSLRDADVILNGGGDGGGLLYDHQPKQIKYRPSSEAPLSPAQSELRKGPQKARKELIVYSLLVRVP